jgi:hypothetical protein
VETIIFTKHTGGMVNYSFEKKNSLLGDFFVYKVIFLVYNILIKINNEELNYGTIRIIYK